MAHRESSQVAAGVAIRQLLVFTDEGRIYDLACGSGSIFVQSEKFVESHGGKLGDISIYRQESNATTRRFAVINLALRADYILSNPRFNDLDRFHKDDDVRWQFDVPPKGNANFAWVQQFIHHFAPQLVSFQLC